MKAKKSSTRLIEVIASLAFLAGGVSGQTYTATHSCVDNYMSPGTVTIQCSFDSDDANELFAFGWLATLPPGWAVTGVTGGGSASWDIYFEEGEYRVYPVVVTTARPVAFSLTVSIPAGETGDKSVSARALSYFDGMDDILYVAADPATLVIGSNAFPVITNAVSMVGLRTKPSTIPDSALLAPAYDPDGDTLTVSAVNTTSTKGSTVTWSGGILGYTPPATNRLGFTENIAYTVTDGHGAEAAGTLTVTVPPAGTAIRVF